MSERMFAVAVRDGEELFLWIRIRRAKRGDVYCVFPTGTEGPEFKDWNPHGSLHRDGRFHHKSFDQKIFPQDRQRPDLSFRGTEKMVERPIAIGEPRAFGVICDPAKFSVVMEVPTEHLSAMKYATYVSIDLAQPGVQPLIEPGNLIQRQTFDDAIPWIVVSVVDRSEFLAGTGASTN